MSEKEKKDLEQEGLRPEQEASEQETEKASEAENEAEIAGEKESAETAAEDGAQSGDGEDDSDETNISDEGIEDEGIGDEGIGDAGGKKSWTEKMAEKKQAKQDKKTDAMKEQIRQLEDKVKRQLAEFENFRNRSEREKQAMFETGAKSVIEKILPVVDNFERGFASVDPEDADDAFVEGMNMVYRQLMTELENIGVKPIEAVGKEFDPNLHNAVMQVESEEYESGIVAQELQKGYTYRDGVVRHSMVSVVQ